MNSPRWGLSFGSSWAGTFGALAASAGAAQRRKQDLIYNQILQEDEEFLQVAKEFLKWVQ